MKRIVLCLLCVLLLTGTASAQDIAAEGAGAACGDQLSWSLEGSTLYITGTGEMYDFPAGAPWAGYKNSISRVVLSGGVTYVGAYAFQDYDALTGVDFGSSLISIGVDAFSGCDGLSSITLPATFKKFGENAFRACTNLKEIHCSGNFPRFDQNCLWDTYATIYYSASNPWSVSLIEQLENAFHNRIEFRSSDGTDPYIPTQATEAPTVSAVPETTQETFWVTQPTTQPTTVPVYTEPATVPVYTEPPTAATQPVQTLPPATTQPTQPTIVLASQATQPEPYQTGPATDGGKIFGVLIVLIVLTILATMSLLFRAAGGSRRKKKRKYRR